MPTNDVSFGPEHRPGDVRIEYRTGARDDIDDLAGLAHGVYGGDLDSRRASISRALECGDNVVGGEQVRRGDRLRQGGLL